MTVKRRRIIRLLPALVLVTLFASCGTSGPDLETAPPDKIRVALILPSASEDLAWSNGMYAGLRTAQGELGADRLEVAIEEDLPSSGDAAASINYYAEQGYDLIIAHAPQYRDTVLELAAAFPDVSFVYGSGTDTASNVFAYDPQAQEGGYVLGMLAGLMTRSNKIGLVGLVEDGDAARYAEGFIQGVAAANTGAEVLTGYTGSYGNMSAAIQMANTYLDGGADYLTGTALRTQGAVQAAADRAVPWLASDMGNTTGWPDAVVAAQVYNWKDLVIHLVDARSHGVLGGECLLLAFGNGRLSFAYADAAAIPAEVRSAIDEAVKAITSGSLVPE